MHDNDDKKPKHLRLVDTKQDLESKINQLLTEAISSENEQETLARMDAESQNFERITGIQAWGPALKDLGKLLICVPFHHSKIARQVKSKELYYDIRKKRWDVNDAKYLGWLGFTVLFAGILMIAIGMLIPDRTKDLANLVSAILIILTGTGLVMFSIRMIIDPWSWCRRLRPYVDSLYEGEKE